MALSPLDFKMRTLARNLISTYGKSVSIVSQATQEYDETTGDADVVESIQRIKGVFTKPETIGMGGSNIVKTDKAYLMVAALGLKKVPDPADEVIIDSERRKIIDVEKVYSGEQVAYYLLDIES